MPTWFITGCSSGLGRNLAQAILARGWNTAVTARDPSRVQDMVDAFPETALALPLEVADANQIKEAVRLTLERFGSIDVLVNNAGHGYRAAVEEGEERDVEELFATNFFGPVAITKAVLPGMRARRSGTIVNISLTAGRFAQPGSGYYSASKCALAGMSDALRKEAAPLGIRVIVVEPSGFRTDFAGRSLQQSAITIDDYVGTAGLRRKEQDKTDGTQPGDPARAAQAIIDVAGNPNPPARLALGRNAVTRIRAELERHIQELDAWASVGLAADFPEAERV